MESLSASRSQRTTQDGTALREFLRERLDRALKNRTPPGEAKVSLGGNAAGFESRRFIRRFANESLWVLAMHGGMKEVDVVHGVITRRCRPIDFAVGLRIGGSHAVSAAHCCLGGCGLDCTEGFALRGVDCVRCFQKLIEVGLIRRKDTDAVAVISKRPLHVEGGPGGNAVTEVFGQDSREIGIVSGNVVLVQRTNTF